MSDINTIKTRLDTDNQKGVISEKEFNDNFGKLDQIDYKKISEGLEAKDQHFLTLLQKPIFENIQKKDLLNKQSLSVNEMKIVKLYFMSYGMNANRSGDREKTTNQKMAEKYMKSKGIWYGLGQDGWNEFKKGFKGNMFNFNKSKGKDISYPAGPINMNHPDIKRLNGEQLQIPQQIENAKKHNPLQKLIQHTENREITTRPLSKKLEELKNKNTISVLDELTSVPNGILYNDNIKEMTYNEKEKIQKIIENVFSNPSINSTQVINYVWKFHCSLGDEKRSNKTGKKIEGSELKIAVDNQEGMRIEIINTCYLLAQAKGFGELQTNPETAKKSLIKLCNILTGRFNSTGAGRMKQKDNDKKFNNPELAKEILENLMQINGTIDKISPVDVLQDEPTLKNKKCESFIAEVSQNIPRPLSGEFGILDLISVDEKTKISQLSPTLQARTIVLKKISEKIKSDLKQVPFEAKYIQELKNLGTKEAKMQQVKFETQKKKFKGEIKKAGKDNLSSYAKSAQEYGLQGADTEILNLYRDFAVNSFWAGQLSDEVDDEIMKYTGYIKEGLKMGAMLGGTMISMMIFPPAGAAGVMTLASVTTSAIAVGVTQGILTQMLYKKMDYNSFAEGAVDISSQFVFDTATAFLGMKVFGPIIQKSPGFFNDVKYITSNLGINLLDVTVGATAEGVRQMGVNELFDKQENVDILQMIRAGGMMATVFFMVSGGFHAKLPVDDMLSHLKANDPKINPIGFKKLNISEIDYQNSIKLLELKSNALKNALKDAELERKIRQINEEIIILQKKIKDIESQLIFDKSNKDLIKESRSIKKEIYNKRLEKKVFLKKEIPGHDLGLSEKRSLFVEGLKDQSTIKDVIIEYPRLGVISENLVIRNFEQKIVKEHLDDLNLLSDKTLKKIGKSEIVIFLSNQTFTGREDNIKFKGVQPRGWDKGNTRDSVAGASKGNRVYSGEGRHGSKSLVLHELGHSIDNIFNITNSPKFKEFHKRFYNNLTSYFQQNGPGGYAGCQEFRAESIAQFYKYGEKKFTKIYDQEFTDYIKANIE